MEASRLYKQALRLVDEGYLFRRDEVQERIGRCLHRAAMQAENRDEFYEMMHMARVR